MVDVNKTGWYSFLSFLGMRENIQSGQQYIAQLIAAYINGHITVEERHELNEWVNENSNNRELFLYFTNRHFIENVKNARLN